MPSTTAKDIVTLDDRPAPPAPPPGIGISERFRGPARRAAAPEAGPVELLPSRLAQVCAEVLRADGVGLSLFSDDFRLPLGASGPAAATAEQLQFTTQDGPCWDAVRYETSLSSDAVTLAGRWPVFWAELRRRTDFRRVASIPLRLGRDAGGAINLYFRDGTDEFDVDDAIAVSAHVAEILNRASGASGIPDPGGDVLPGPRWTRGPAARRRSAVWIASGMLMSERIPTAQDALAVLRAAAYSEGRTVDDLAGDLVAGRSKVDDVLADRDPPA